MMQIAELICNSDHIKILFGIQSRLLVEFYECFAHSRVNLSCKAPWVDWKKEKRPRIVPNLDILLCELKQRRK
jgi:hypothetical protein